MPPGPGTSHRSREITRRFRAWMVVAPVDVVALLLPGLWETALLPVLLVAALLTVVLTAGTGRYRARLHVSLLDELPLLTATLILANGAATLGWVLLTHEERADRLPEVLLAAWGLMILGRAFTDQLVLLARRRRVTVHRTVVVGGSGTSADLLGLLGRHPRYGLLPVGYVSDAPAGDEPASATTPRLGAVDTLDAAVRELDADVIVLGEHTGDELALLEVLRRPACLRCEVLVIPRLHRCRTGATDHVGSIPVMRIGQPTLRGPGWGLKRVTDLLVAAGLLVVLSPVMALVAVAVRLEGPGVLFRQERIGRDGAAFVCLKFRSMRPVAAQESDTAWTVDLGIRTGPVGRFLRRTSIDELPQLWNVVRGDMTLVGPRPERPHFADRFTHQYPLYRSRLRVRAGMTGLAQVSGLRGDVSVEERANVDNYYIENWSLWLDLKILLRTLTEVVLARGR